MHIEVGTISKPIDTIAYRHNADAHRGGHY